MGRTLGIIGRLLVVIIVAICWEASSRCLSFLMDGSNSTSCDYVSGPYGLNQVCRTRPWAWWSNFKSDGAFDWVMIHIGGAMFLFVIGGCLVLVLCLIAWILGAPTMLNDASVKGAGHCAVSSCACNCHEGSKLGRAATPTTGAAKPLH